HGLRLRKGDAGGEGSEGKGGNGEGTEGHGKLLGEGGWKPLRRCGPALFAAPLARVTAARHNRPGKFFVPAVTGGPSRSNHSRQGWPRATSRQNCTPCSCAARPAM